MKRALALALLLVTVAATPASAHSWRQWLDEYRVAHPVGPPPSGDVLTPALAEALSRYWDRFERRDHQAWVAFARARERWAAAREAAERRAAEAAAQESLNSDAPDTRETPVSSTRSSGIDWWAVAECESGGDWSINTGNGYYGGLQFSPSTWHAAGGNGYPHHHSRETQIAVAERWVRMTGCVWCSSGWPGCGRYA